jgi:hypothetical protein
MRANLEESLLRSGEYTDSSGDPLFPVDLDSTIDNPGILSVTMEDRLLDWNRTFASMGSIYLPMMLYTALRDCVVRTVSTARRSKHSYITPEVLARNWGISLETTTAWRTLDATTQLGGVRTRPQDLVRRFKTNDRMLQYTRLNVEMYTDTAKAAVKSHDQMQWVQVYCTAGGWVKAYPMARRSDAPLTLQDLLKEGGAPFKLILDNSLEQIKGNFRKIARDAGI